MNTPDRPSRSLGLVLDGVALRYDLLLVHVRLRASQLRARVSPTRDCRLSFGQRRTLLFPKFP